jgi:zinc protease
MRRLLLAAILTFLLAPFAAAANIERVVSPLGIEAWLIEDHSNQLISVTIGFHGGSATDSKAKQGLARLTAALLDEGAGDMDSAAFQGRLDELGIEFGFDADWDNFTGGMRLLTRDRDEAFRLLGLALSAPRFDADAVNRVKAQMLSAIAGDADDPETLAWQSWLRLALGDHPYTWPIKGTTTSIAAISAADLKAFVARRLARDQMKIAVVGDIDAQTLGVLLDRSFAALPAKAAPIEVPEARFATPGGVAVMERNLAQSVVQFGGAGIARQDPDFYAAALIGDIMGAGNLTSRLEGSLREQRGLVYSVETYNAPYDHVAILGGSLATKNATAGEAIALVRAEWQRMHDEGPTAKELADAKTHIIGAFPVRFTSTYGAAQALLDIQLEGLPIDYVDHRETLYQKVTLEDARRVAKRIYDTPALRFLVLGHPEGVKGTLPSPPAE